MAASVNTVIISGNLTRDPELRHTGNGTAVTDLRLAVNRRVKRGDRWEDETAFIDVTAWGRQAENCCKYLRKGSPALAEGQLKMDEWEDRNSGEKRSKLGVVANRVHFLGTGGSKRDGNESTNEDGNLPF